MSETQDLKRSLKRDILRQTVAENLALMEGSRLPREGLRQRSSPRWPLVLGLTVPLLIAAAFAGSPFFPHSDARSDAGSGMPSSGNDTSTVTADTVEALLPDDARAPQPPRGPLRPNPSRWATEPPAFDDKNFAIDPSVFPLQVRTVVLDPGHGGEDRGTTNSKLREKDLTLDIGLRLRDLLRRDGFTVLMTREDDRAVVLKDRRDFANDNEADVFVSIHINWISTRVRGVETYFLGPAKDPQLAELARRENQNSGYALADQDNIIRGVILNAQHERSHQLATSVQRSLLGSLRRVRPGLQNRGVKTAPFVVLVATEMPAILAEVACLSNREEAELLGRPLYRDHIAEALSAGIRSYARQVNQAEENGS